MSSSPWTEVFRFWPSFGSRSRLGIRIWIHGPFETIDPIRTRNHSTGFSRCTSIYVQLTRSSQNKIWVLELEYCDLSWPLHPIVCPVGGPQTLLCKPQKIWLIWFKPGKAGQNQFFKIRKKSTILCIKHTTDQSNFSAMWSRLCISPWFFYVLLRFLIDTKKFVNVP